MKNKAFNTIKGTFGEQLAFKYVKSKLKFKILDKNFKCALGEIDIIAKDKKTIVFIEVKFKTSLAFGSPREMVTNYKQQKIKQVAQFYLKSKNLFDSMVRFDVAEVIDEDVEYIFDAF